MSVAHSVKSQGYYSCNTCGVQYRNSEAQKQHMKSDWHRYNLKRRVAELPTISGEIFAEKVLKKEILLDGRNENEDEDGFYVHEKKKTSANVQLTKKAMRKMNKQVLRHNETLLHGRLHRSGSVSTVVTQDSNFTLGESVVTDSVTASYVYVESEESASVGVYESENDAETASVVSDVEAPPQVTASSESGASRDAVNAGNAENAADDNFDIIAVNGCLYCNLEHETLESALAHMYQAHGLYVPHRSKVCDMPGLVRFLWHFIYVENECIHCGFLGKSLESVQDHCMSKGHCSIPFETNFDKRMFAEYYTNLDEILDVSELEKDEFGIELSLPTGYKVGHRSMARYYKQDLKPAAKPKESKSTVLMAGYVNMGRTHAVAKNMDIIVKKQHENKEFSAGGKKLKVRNYQKHFRKIE